MAARLQARREGLGRSVMVVFFAAEEAGLQGSQFFVRSDPVDLAQVAAMVNLDMVGRPLVDQRLLAPLKGFFGVDEARSIGVVGASGRPAFARVVDAAGAKTGMQVFGTVAVPFVSQVIEGMSKNRSDNAPFEWAGVPTLFFGSGESDDYHQPGDTVDKVIPVLMARRAELVLETVLALSSLPAGELPPKGVDVPGFADRIWRASHPPPAWNASRSKRPSRGCFSGPAESPT